MSWMLSRCRLRLQSKLIRIFILWIVFLRAHSHIRIIFAFVSETEYSTPRWWFLCTRHKKFVYPGNWGHVPKIEGSILAFKLFIRRANEIVVEIRKFKIDFVVASFNTWVIPHQAFAFSFLVLWRIHRKFACIIITFNESPDFEAMNT